MKKWKVALIGCGSIAEGTYLPYTHKFPNVEMVAVCDIVKERADAYAHKFNIPGVYYSIDDLLSLCDFDVLMNTASIQAHYEINMKALNAGKHVYSQKPVALTVDQVTDMINAAEKSGVKFSASPIHMLRPDVRWAKQMIENRTIGKVSLIHCVASHGGPEYFQFRQVDPTWFYREGAGALYDLGVHALHMVTGLLGPAKAVSCVCATGERTRTIRSGAFDGKVMRTDDMPDNYVITLDFGDDTLAVVETSYVVKARRGPSLEIYGTQGTISFTDDPKHPLEVYLDAPDLSIRGWMTPNVQEITDLSFFQCQCLSDLIEAVECDRPVGLKPEHARHVVEIMCKVPIAAREHTTLPLNTTF